MKTANNHAIELTGSHLIYKSDCETLTRTTVQSKDLEIGDCLMTQSGDIMLPDQIVEIKKVFRVSSNDSSHIFIDISK